MANKTLHKIMARGYEAWNKWRRDNPEAEIDLSGEDLFRAHFTGYDLRKTNFEKCDLRESFLREADFRKAKFRGARLNRVHFRQANLAGADFRDTAPRTAEMDAVNLRGANLSGTDLSYADLKGADLTRGRLNNTNLHAANLRGAILRFASFRGTNLDGAHLEGAIIGGTTFRETDLSGVERLAGVIHNAPSLIDNATIQKSRGKIPIGFLQGCGLTDQEILNVINMRPISEKWERGISDQNETGDSSRYQACFISHENQDRVLARELSNFLQKKGVRTWILPEDIKLRNSILRRACNQARPVEKLLVILPEKDDGKTQEKETGNVILFCISAGEVLLAARSPLADLVSSRTPIAKYKKWQRNEAYAELVESVLRILIKT